MGDDISPEPSDARPRSIIRNEHGFWCAACGEAMTSEEIDFDECDCCGGYGIEGDEDGDYDE